VDAVADVVADRAYTSRMSPAVATTSPSHRPALLRSCRDQLTAANPNMRLARIAPPIAPAICADTYTVR
jgi:hypothetical protein